MSEERKVPTSVSKYMSRIGRIGGMATGKCKARSSEDASRASKIRWAKWRREKAAAAEAEAANE